MIEILKMQLPLTFYLGSKPIELVEAVAPWLIKCADLGVMICLAGAALRPGRLTTYRIGGMMMVLLLTTTKTLGGYAEVFLLFLIFFEKWEGIAVPIALIAAYALSVPWDYILVKIVHVEGDAWLSGRRVAFDTGLTLGGMAQPGLLLAIQYGLVVASLADLVRRRQCEPERAIESPDPPAAPGLEAAVSGG